MKQVLMLVAGVFAGAAMAGTLYVNNGVDVGNDAYDGKAAAWDGTHGPKFTIQSAVDEAEAGDTILVAPGVYGDEQGAVDGTTAGHACRVYIDKPLTLKASGSRAETHLVGKRFAGESGWGAGAVTAIRIAADVGSGAEGDKVRIEGFTIRDCATDGVSTEYGGIIGWRSSTVPNLKTGSGPWVVDCTISNCCYNVAGGLYHVNAARVYLKDNYSNQVGVNAHQCNLLYCVSSGCYGQAGYNGTVAQYVINCTFCNTANNPFSSSSKVNLLNSIVTASSMTGVWCSTASNNVLSKVTASVSAGANVTGNATLWGQVAGPLVDDFRPLVYTDVIGTNAVACAAGDAAWLDVVPEEFRYVDFAGTAFTPVGGKVAAGAVQTPLVPVAGFSNQSQLTLLIDGKRGLGTGGESRYATFTYLGADTWPRVFELTATPAEGQHLYGFTSSDSTAVRFPTRDGRALYVPEKGRLTAVQATMADLVRYVDRNAGDDDAYDGSSATVAGSVGPYASIQKAVDSIAANKYGVIYVAEGVYDNGASEWDSGVLPKLRVKLSSNRHQRLVATGAAERTVIKGAADTTSADHDVLGNGAEAVRCVRVAANCKCCFQGFTLTEGRTVTTATPGVKASWRSGGAFMCEGGKTAWLMDCVIAGNAASGSGAALYGGKAARCRFSNNVNATSTGPAIFHYPTDGIYSHLVGCEITADASSAAAVFGAASTRFVHCSAYSPVETATVPNYHGYLFNNLIVGNASFGGDAASSPSAGNVIEDSTYVAGNPLNAGAFATGAAGFVDAANGDLRLLTSSDAIGAGANAAMLNDATRWTDAEIYENYYALLQHDFEGNRPATLDERPAAGAHYRPSKARVKIAVNLPERVYMTPSEPETLLDIGESLEITAVSDTRRIEAIEVNGERLSDVFTVTVTASAADRADYDIKVYANTNWYVDAVGGNDANEGWSEAEARQSLNEIMSRAEPGDTVIALPGTYELGAMLQEAPYHADSATELYSRVVVPAGVRLVSRDGAEKTVISGMVSEEASHFGYDSMRAVYLLPNSSLDGFTVCNGSTFDNGSTDKIMDDYVCGGVFCAEAPNAFAEPTIWVKDCIISNNYGHTYSAGACYGGGFVRCRFFWNRCRAGGAHGVNVARLYECILDHGRGTYGINQPYRTRGCTFGADNMNYDETAARAAVRCDPGSSTDLWPIWNSLFLGNARCPVRSAHNCVVPKADFLYTEKTDSNWTDITVAQVQVDGRYAPNRVSAAIDAANPDYVLPIELEGDVYGHARSQIGGIDVGAVEAGEPTALFLLLR